MKKKKTNAILHNFFTATSYVSPRLNTELLFMRKFGRRVELNNPKTLNEKLLKLKLEEYGTDETVRMCADKYRVREFIKARGLENILNGLIAVYDRPEDIEWESLPERFAIKWNFGCGYNVICADKSRLDIPATVRKLKKWGREPFWAFYSELQYRGVEKKLIIEEYLGSEDGSLPEDYKFYCFNGKPYCVMLCEGRDEGWPKFYFFDRNFKLLRINRDSVNAPNGFTLPKPAGLDEAFEAAEILSGGFKFVRVDLYIKDGSVYFGEMTFTPAAALDNKRLPETDLMFGAMME